MGFLDDMRRSLGVPAPEPGDTPEEPPESPRARAATPPWERLPGEPDAAWLEFRAYLEAPSASIAAFARGASAATHATSVLQAMAARWRWLARRAALEAHLARERTASAEEAARAQGEQIARSVQRQLDQAQAAAIAFELRGGLERASLRDVIAYQKQAIELARLLRGEVVTRVGLDAEALSQEERDRLRALVEKATARAGGSGSGSGSD